MDTGEPDELEKLVPRPVQAMFSPRVLRLWAAKSVTLLAGTLAYNLFVIIVLEPILLKLFPPLNWREHVRSVFTGHSSRYTYQDLLPYIGPFIWILGNAFWFALLNRNLREVKAAEQEHTRV